MAEPHVLDSLLPLATLMSSLVQQFRARGHDQAESIAMAESLVRMALAARKEGLIPMPTTPHA
jgi:predicted alternative tryptophan synthase beta-subunit